MVAFRLRPIAGSEARSLTVSVKRYTPQAVLIANIEEARYRVLAAEDGLLLVDAQYAVRNNQRSFLKVTLPPRATIWSASVARKPVRPGVAEGDAVLIALEKGRAGEDAPTFAVRITYLQPADPWLDRTPARIVLPALDLPISRTGVALYHSPRLRIGLQPGAFRLDSDPGPFAEALRFNEEGMRGVGAGLSGGTLMAPSAPPPPMAAALPAPSPGAALLDLTLKGEGRDAQFKTLIDRYRNEGGGRTVAGTLPVNVTFPELGPSIFLASELTAESQAPSIELTTRRIKS
jgi:hypothetical protein